jgi:hypothetical protein
VRDWVIGSLQMQASAGRIQQRVGDNKRIDLRASGEAAGDTDGTFPWGLALVSNLVLKG